MAMKTSQKLGIVLLFCSLVVIASVIGYAYLQTQSPENKNFGKIQISWYVPEYDELIADSDLIVVATVTDKTGIWDTKNGQKPLLPGIQKRGINTEYTFMPEDVLKGNTTTIIGRVRGGEADGYTQRASPTASFEVGDKVLLFLKNNEDADGNRILWYYVSWPTSFIENGDGKFENMCYDALSIEQLKQDIAASETA